MIERNHLRLADFYEKGLESRLKCRYEWLFVCSRECIFSVRASDWGECKRPAGDDQFENCRGKRGIRKNYVRWRAGNQRTL